MGLNWEEIKKTLYFVDGSLRDIYINNISVNQWKKWITYINKNYRLNWNNEDKINFRIIKKNWSENLVPETAKIFIGNIQINCHFFCDFENDIDPKEIQNINDHNCIINYMKNISVELDTVIYLSSENIRDNYFLKIYKDEIYGI